MILNGLINYATVAQLNKSNKNRQPYRRGMKTFWVRLANHKKKKSLGQNETEVFFIIIIKNIFFKSRQLFELVSQSIALQFFPNAFQSYFIPSA